MEKYQQDLLHRHSLEFIKNLNIDNTLEKLYNIFHKRELNVTQDTNNAAKCSHLIDLLKRYGTRAYWVFCHVIRSQSRELFKSLHCKENGDIETNCPECGNYGDEIGGFAFTKDWLKMFSKINGVIVKEPNDIIRHIQARDNEIEKLQREKDLLIGYVQSLKENLTNDRKSMETLREKCEDHPEMRNRIFELENLLEERNSDLKLTKELLEMEKSRSDTLLNKIQALQEQLRNLPENEESNLKSTKEALEIQKLQNNTLHNQLQSSLDENRLLGNKYEILVSEKREIADERDALLSELNNLKDKLSSSALEQSNNAAYFENLCTKIAEENYESKEATPPDLPKKKYPSKTPSLKIRAKSVDSELWRLDYTRQKGSYSYVESAQFDIDRNIVKDGGGIKNVLVIKKRDEEFGIQLQGGNKVGIFISSVKPSSPADKYELLKGWKILKINGVSLYNVAFCYAYEFFKKQETNIEVTFTVEAVPFHEYEKQLEKKPYDCFYVRALKSYRSHDVGDMSFVDGETICIIDSCVKTEPDRPYQWRGVKPNIVGSSQTSGTVPRQISIRSPSAIAEHQYAVIDSTTKQEKTAHRIYYRILDQVGDVLI